MIFKLQRPLATNLETPYILIYDQTRKIERFVIYDEETAKIFGDLPKVYVEGKIRDNTLIVDRVVPEQDW